MLQTTVSRVLATKRKERGKGRERGGKGEKNCWLDRWERELCEDLGFLTLFPDLNSFYFELMS